MSTIKDMDYLAKLERAIAQKYGDIATINPRSGWNNDKEAEYSELLKDKLKLEAQIDSAKHSLDLDGVLIQKRLLNIEQKRECEYCNSYSFNRDDDVYFSKYGTCHKCYVKYIEDREDRWKNGWRPGINGDK